MKRVESDQELAQRYLKAVHRQQSALAFLIEVGHANMVAPKHLRVGVNNAMADHGALVQLLVAKGVITDREYRDAIADGAEREAEQMVAEARRVTGNPGLDFA